MHAHRRFFIALGATALAIVALFWLDAAFLPIGFMPQEYAMGEARKQMLAECHIPSMVIQGDSRSSAGLIPARVMPGVVNLSFGGSTPLELYYTSKQILDCGPAPKQVLLNISPQLFIRPPYFWDRAGLFGWLTFDQLEEARKLSRTLKDTTFFDAPKFADGDAILNNFLHAVAFPSYYSSYIANHLFVGRFFTNREVIRRTRSTLGQHEYGHDDGSSAVAEEADIESFEPAPILDVYMDRFLDLYAEKGTEVHFIAVPLNHATYVRMKPAVIREFAAYLDRLAARHPNFHVMGPAVGWRDDAWFGDSTHMNTVGAEHFSDEVHAMLVAARISP